MLKGIPYIQSSDQVDTAKLVVNFGRDLIKMLNKGTVAVPLVPIIEPTPDKLVLDGDLKKDLLALLDKHSDNKQAASIRQLLLQPSDPQTLISSPVFESSAANSEVSPQGGSDEPDIKSSSSDVNIPDELKLRIVPSKTALLEELWSALPGVGMRIAPLLRELGFKTYFTLPYDQLETTIANLRHDGGTCVGTKRAKDIAIAAYTGDNATKQEKARTAQVKLLAAVPGISLETSKQILKKLSIADICTGKLDAKCIKKIEIPSTKSKSKVRTIGPILSARLVELFYI